MSRFYLKMMTMDNVQNCDSDRSLRSLHGSEEYATNSYPVPKLNLVHFCNLFLRTTFSYYPPSMSRSPRCFHSHQIFILQFLYEYLNSPLRVGLGREQEFVPFVKCHFLYQWGQRCKNTSSRTLCQQEHVLNIVCIVSLWATAIAFWELTCERLHVSAGHSRGDQLTLIYETFIRSDSTRYPFTTRGAHGMQTSFLSALRSEWNYYILLLQSHKNTNTLSFLVHSGFKMHYCSSGNWHATQEHRAGHTDVAQRQ
jgi:hypothetical protein